MVIRARDPGVRWGGYHCSSGGSNIRVGFCPVKSSALSSAPISFRICSVKISTKLFAAMPTFRMAPPVGSSGLRPRRSRVEVEKMGLRIGQTRPSIETYALVLAALGLR